MTNGTLAVSSPPAAASTPPAAAINPPSPEREDAAASQDKLAAYRLRRDEDQRGYGRQSPLGPQLTRLYRDYLQDQLPLYLLAMALLVVYSASVAALPYLLENVVDRFLTARDAAAIRQVALLGGAIILVRAVSNFLQRAALSYASLRATRAMQQDSFAALLRQDYAFFLVNPPGQIIDRAWNAPRTLGNLGQQLVINLGRDGLTALGLIAYLLISNWVWALLLLILAPLLVVPLLITNRLLRVLAQRRAGVEGDGLDALSEVVGNIRAVKLNRGDASETRRLGQRIAALFRLGRQSIWFAGGVEPVLDFVAAIALTAVLLYGGGQVVSGQASAGELIAYLGAIVLVVEPLRRLLTLNVTIQSAIPSLERMYDILDRQPQITDAAEAQPLTERRAVTLRFEGVSFSYDGRQPAVSNLTFTLPPGRMLALVGASGSGKSTVAALLGRLFDVDAGRISLNDRDIRSLPLADLRALVAVVAQNSPLFAGTIAENIAYGQPALTANALQAAAARAQVLNFSQRLPDGLDSPVGPRGDQLSGGQKQRVAIARALAQQAPILLLDEATAALDNETERAFLAQIDQLQAEGDRSLIVIAHRLSTVRNADEILVLDHGQIVERGSYAALASAGGAFSQMLAAGG